MPQRPSDTPQENGHEVWEGGREELKRELVPRRPGRTKPDGEPAQAEVGSRAGPDPRTKNAAKFFNMKYGLTKRSITRTNWGLPDPLMFVKAPRVR